MIHGRDAQGRFISKKRAQEQKALVERTKPLKIVVYRERIKGTRIARTMKRSYPYDKSDDEIAQELQKQYDQGGNYVMNITSISFGYDLKAGDSVEVERGLSGSADVSP